MSRGLDVLAAQKEAAAARLAVFGGSWGGFNAILLAGLDERVRCVSSGYGAGAFRDTWSNCSRLVFTQGEPRGAVLARHGGPRAACRAHPRPRGAAHRDQPGALLAQLGSGYRCPTAAWFPPRDFAQHSSYGHRRVAFGRLARHMFRPRAGLAACTGPSCRRNSPAPPWHVRGISLREFSARARG